MKLHQYKCDRCGITYEKNYKPVELDVIIKNICGCQQVTKTEIIKGFVYRIEEERCRHRETMYLGKDLCDDCVEALMKFMRNEPVEPTNPPAQGEIPGQTTL